MNIHNYIIVILIFVGMGCNTTLKTSIDDGNKDSRETSPLETKENTGTGVFEMGIIDFRITDSTQIDQEKADLMIALMRGKMEYDVVYNKTRVADIRYYEDGQIFSRLTYDKTTEMLYEFIYTDNGNFYYEQDNGQMMSEMGFPTEDSLLISQMFKIEEGVEHRLNIFGYDCKKIIMMQPDDFSKEIMTVYCSDDIPFITSSMGPLGEVMTGLPLKTSINMLPGLIITTGAVSHKFDDSKLYLLNTETTGFVQRNKQEIENIKREFGNN